MKLFGIEDDSAEVSRFIHRRWQDLTVFHT